LIFGAISGDFSNRTKNCGEILALLDNVHFWFEITFARMRQCRRANCIPNQSKSSFMSWHGSAQSKNLWSPRIWNEIKNHIWNINCDRIWQNVISRYFKSICFISGNSSNKSIPTRRRAPGGRSLNTWESYAGFMIIMYCPFYLTCCISPLNAQAFHVREDVNSIF
jgi:hypothetical protein